MSSNFFGGRLSVLKTAIITSLSKTTRRSTLALTSLSIPSSFTVPFKGASTKAFSEKISLRHGKFITFKAVVIYSSFCLLSSLGYSSSKYFVAIFHLSSAGILGSICKREWIIRPLKNLSVFSGANKERLLLI